MSLGSLLIGDTASMTYISRRTSTN